MTDAADVAVLPLPESAPAMSVASEHITVDAQVATAKAYPRNVTRCLENALTMACMDATTAASMTYALKKGGEQIIGPSARLAEVMVQSWGNIRADIEPLEANDKYVTAMATVFDVENNVAIRIKVQRRITNKHGKRYSDDLIIQTAMAASSIAYRNAVFKVIPPQVWKKVWAEAKVAATGDEKTIETRRANALDWFVEQGVMSEQVFEWLGVHRIEEIDATRLLLLLSSAQAIREGTTTVEEMFRRPGSSEEASELDQALAGDNDAK